MGVFEQLFESSSGGAERDSEAGVGPWQRVRGSRGLKLGVVVVLLLMVGTLSAAILFPQAVADVVSEDDRKTVTLRSDGETVATVDAEVASTRSEMVTGLSDHQSLPSGEGMLFIHSGATQRHTYVMRDMSFPIDIVFIDADCEITSIQTAAAPGPNETGTEPKHQYTGQAKYVLEVPDGFAAERVESGDSVRFDGGC